MIRIRVSKWYFLIEVELEVYTEREFRMWNVVVVVVPTMNCVCVREIESGQVKFWLGKKKVLSNLIRSLSTPNTNTISTRLSSRRMKERKRRRGEHVRQEKHFPRLYKSTPESFLHSQILFNTVFTHD